MVGQFFTPALVAECMFRLAGVRPGDRVIDPSCGDGSFLRSAAPGLDLHGCEIDPRHAASAAPLLPPGNLVAGDALASLDQTWGTYDLAIGNPPFSAQASLEKRPDLLRRYDLGARRKSQCLEVLFLELFWKLVKPDGKIAIILPDGPFANRNFRHVRDWLLHRAHVEAIISLPRGIFRQTSAKTNLLVARRLPVAALPYLEPTALLECTDLGELKPLPLADWRRLEPRWKQTVLAHAKDWRPEAHATPTTDAADASSDASSDAADTATVRLGDLFKMRTGYALYGAKRELFEQPDDHRVPLIRAKNVSPDGGLRLDQNLAYIARDGEMFNDRGTVRPGEILFVRVGVGCYGRTALVPPGLDAQVDDWIHVLTPHADLDAVGALAWFNSAEGRTAVRKLAKGVGTLSVSKSSLAELRLPASLQKTAPRRPTPAAPETVEPRAQDPVGAGLG
ncbi:MAG: N-6 DNA methylase [Burkholderiales bacterium]|nr:N-6 DNA methylase [Opitutaceae bacterium]